MSGLSRRAAEAEHEIGAEWTRYHVGAQATRFLAGALTTLLWSLHNGFSDWTDLVPLAGTAAWTTAAHMWPSLPWDLVWEHFGNGKPEPAVPPAVAAEVPPASGAAAAGTEPPPVKG